MWSWFCPTLMFHLICIFDFSCLSVKPYFSLHWISWIRFLILVGSLRNYAGYYGKDQSCLYQLRFTFHLKIMLNVFYFLHYSFPGLLPSPQMCKTSCSDNFDQIAWELPKQVQLLHVISNCSPLHGIIVAHLPTVGPWSLIGGSDARMPAAQKQEYHLIQTLGLYRGKVEHTARLSILFQLTKILADFCKFRELIWMLMG